MDLSVLNRAHKWADSANHPNPHALRQAGYVGIFLYGGTDSPKNATPDYYAECRAAGLQTAWWYEHTGQDFASGENGGHTHALALLAHMTVCRAGIHEPAGAAVDTHLSAANIDQAVAYQRGFWRAMHLHPTVAYGFAEFIAAVMSAGVAEVFVQAGSSHLVLNDIHFWQDNRSQPVVGGSQIDIDWQLLPLPQPPPTEVDMQTTDPIPQNPKAGTIGEVFRDWQVGQAGVVTAGRLVDILDEIASGINAISSKLDQVLNRASS